MYFKEFFKTVVLFRADAGLSYLHCINIYTTVLCYYDQFTYSTQLNSAVELS